MEEIDKLWKHHTNHLREMCQRNEHKYVPSCNNNPKFEGGQTFEPKYLLDYRVLQILNDSALLLITPDGKERKMNINVTPCSILKLVENAWDSFLGSTKSNCQKCTYNLRPRP